MTANQFGEPYRSIHTGHTGQGHLFLLSAPSGAGKTTLCKAILLAFPDMVYSVSYTTRTPRPGEQDGRDYFFISTEAFESGIKKGMWAEWAQVHGNYYGTRASSVEEVIKTGRDILMDIDVQGALQIRKRFPQVVTFFIMPPSMTILKQRLIQRGGENEESLALRLVNAEKEIDQRVHYHHVLINDRLDDAISELISMINTYRSKPQSTEAPGEA